MSDFRYYRPNNFPPIVKNLVIINVLVWLAQQIFDKQYDLTARLGLYPIMPQKLYQILLDSHFYKDYEKFQPYQIATHMFTHGPVYHILFNMFALWMFGRILENVWGGKRFLLFYLICGVGAAAFHLAIQYFRCEQLLNFFETNGVQPTPLLAAASSAVGASGAIMGIMAAFAYLFPNTELFILFIPFPIKAKWAVIGYAAYDIFGGLSGTDNVAHFAHLGGALTGLILVMIWNKTDKKRFY